MRAHVAAQLNADRAAILAALTQHQDSASATHAALLTHATHAATWATVAGSVHTTASAEAGEHLTQGWQSGGATLPDYDASDALGDWTDAQAQAGAQGVQDHTGRMLRDALGTAALLALLPGVVNGLYDQWTGQTDQGDYAAQVAGQWTRAGWAAGEQDAANAASASGLYGASKQWLSVGDDRVRATHDDADGQVVDYDQPFIVGGEELDYPCDPAGSASETEGCRCSMIWTLANGANADADTLNELENESD